MTRLLALVERVGNRLPDPATLFVLLGLVTLALSAVGAARGWSVPDPRDPSHAIAVQSLLTADGVRWMFTSALRNFLDFPPLAIVLVSMLGIGLAERTGLFQALLRLLVGVTPRAFLTPVVVFIGVNASAAADAGFVVLPPLAAGMYACMARSPLAGIAAAMFGVAGGFSANLAITSLDPLLAGLTEQAARAVDPAAAVRPECNWYFMVASTFLLTAIGWWVGDRVVEPRFSPSEVRAQIAAGGDAAALGVGAGQPGDAPSALTASQRRGLLAAAIAFLLTCAALAAMVALPGGPLHGEMLRPSTSTQVPAWSEAIIPIILLLFLLPGIAYGLAAGELRSDRCVASRMTDAMASMGSFVVLAFFAGQAIAWFRQSNLAGVLGVGGADLIRSLGLGTGPMLVAVVLVTAAVNLLVSSASAKWAFMAPVLVPMLGAAGMRPEVVQAAYRVGDSCTNPVAPLSPYLVIVLIVIRRYKPDAGLGTLFALLLPYSMAALAAWTAFLVLWNRLGIPLGPG